MPLALPGANDGEPLGEAFAAWSAGLVNNPALRRLVELSGWDVPQSPPAPTADVLVALAARSEDWDARRGAERHRLSHVPAEVGGHVVDEAEVIAAASALGLVGGMPVSGRFTHLVVLGGMVRACRARVGLAADLGRQLGTDRYVVLTAHRPLSGAEPEHAEELGWGRVTSEREAAALATREILALPATPRSIEKGVADLPRPAGDPGADPAEVDARRRWSWATWDDGGGERVEVVSAPSGDPDRRRANTVDQLVFWAGRERITRHHRLLLVTTDHYVPPTQLRAVRVLGLPTGCGIVTTGTAWNPPGPYRAAGYLQELRSTLLAAVELQSALTETPPVASA